MLNFALNEERCIKCGKCVNDCPTHCIAMEKGGFPSIPEEGNCLRCQHCLAICPTAAVSILGYDPDNSISVKHEMPTAHSMETLVKARRSIRKYKKKPLDRQLIEKLLNTSWHAPTGVNAQGVLFTATLSAEATESLRQEIYGRLEGLLADLAPTQDTLAHKYMRMSLKAKKENDIDIILRDAPHVLIASAPKSIPTPKEDCIIALSNFDLLGQANSVGTLWNGMLKWCLQDFFPDLAVKLGIPENHEIGYAMVFGTPAVEYPRTVQRNAPAMNLLETL